MYNDHKNCVLFKPHAAKGGGLVFNYDQNLIIEDKKYRQIIWVVPDDLFLEWMVIKDFDETCAWYKIGPPFYRHRLVSFRLFFERYLNDYDASRIVSYEKFKKASGLLYGEE